MTCLTISPLCGDPLETSHKVQKDVKAAPTIKELGDGYIKRHAEVNKKSWEEDQRILEKEVYPAWGRLKAQDITKGNVIALLDKVVDRGSPQTSPVLTARNQAQRLP